MLGMWKIAALLDKQRYEKTTNTKWGCGSSSKLFECAKTQQQDHVGTTIKLTIKSKIIAVQEITVGVAIKINMRYMLRQAKIICECRVWTLHSLLGVLAYCY
jgi:hypothetical protein